MRKKPFNAPIGVRWECLRCSKCCGDTSNKKRRILLLSSEAKQIKEAISTPIIKFCRRTGFQPFIHEMKKPSGKCFFLKNNQCQIYSLRPLVCRFYPFWLEKDENNFSFKVTDECTGVSSGHVLGGAFFYDLFNLANNRINMRMDTVTGLPVESLDHAN